VQGEVLSVENPWLFILLAPQGEKGQISPAHDLPPLIDLPELMAYFPISQSSHCIIQASNLSSRGLPVSIVKKDFQSLELHFGVTGEFGGRGLASLRVFLKEHFPRRIRFSPL
jgi:hypothetical protein